MCGVVGIVAHNPVNQEIFDALTTLQHRGQDAAGIATCTEHGAINIQKDNGLVRDVIRTRHMYRLQGQMGIGHVRYPTAGSDCSTEAQPFYVNSPYGIVLAHNGNLTNSQQLRKELRARNMRHLNTNSDSEVLLNIFAHALQNLNKVDITPEDIFKAVAAVHERCEGAYAVVAMIADIGIVAFRDPHGIRPLIYGKRDGASGTEYITASESVALDVLDYTPIADVHPGEAIFISTQGELSRQQCAKHHELSPCLFEYVYLARPDSMLDSISVYKVRLRLGTALAEKISREWGEHGIDVVMPIPDTSRTAAAVLARKMGLKFREGFVKNRYIGRTFIMPGQTLRRQSVRQKLNPIELEFKNKNVLLVDDSIVRGTTGREIIKMAREAGANKVYFASAAPEVRHPNVYGIDMPNEEELIAHGRTVEEMCTSLGADRLIFQDITTLYDAAKEGNSTIQRFEDSVFTGHYLTGDIDEAYLHQLKTARADTT